MSNSSKNEFIEALTKEFASKIDPERAKQQKAYMRNQFEFFGLTAGVRRDLSKPFMVKKFLPPKKVGFQIARSLWDLPQREFQLFAQEFLHRYSNQIDKSDLSLIEYIIRNKSWWDTIDFIAVRIVDTYFKKFPDLTTSTTDRWISSGNIWLQRSAILFQLKRKNEINTVLLNSIIQRLTPNKEFFINKAIGWILREYSRTNPEWVIDYIENNPKLSNLSKREGLRLIQD